MSRGCIIVGDYAVDVDFDDDGRSFEVDVYRLRFAAPPLKIVASPVGTPDTVIKAIDGATAVIWTDPSAAANRLRVAIEELLTAHRIRRFRNVRGKRIRLNTHDRIQEFGQYKTRPAETLEAVKWIGNQGSHEAALTATNVLEGAELLGFALRELYDKTEKQMERKVRTVNKRPGEQTSRKLVTALRGDGGDMNGQGETSPDIRPGQP